MKAFRHLKFFLADHDTLEKRGEIREYLRENADEYAQLFGVSRMRFLAALTRVSNDMTLVRKLREEMKRIEREGRETRFADRVREAQHAAEALAGSATWKDGRRLRTKDDVLARRGARLDPFVEERRCYLDPSLVRSVLTYRDAWLVFVADVFPETVAIPMRPLFRFGDLPRTELRMWISEKGLHVRWGAAGGLNFHRVEGRAPDGTIMVALPSYNARVA